MKTLNNIFDILTTQESNLFEHKGRYIDFQNNKRSNWNHKRNYGF